jgi:DNA polymerase-3 subunit epsilon/ATP-dependent DNA helicase DinG
MSTTYVAIDLETTGLDPNSEEIIEVAAVTFRGEEILDEYASLVNPYRDLPPFITKLTGINQAMVDEAPEMFSLRPKLKRRLGEHLLVGHNVGFDLAFLHAADLAWGNRRLDTLELASILLPDAGRYGLGALTSYLSLPGSEDGQAHRALDDARWTAYLFMELQRRALELDFNILTEIVEAGRRAEWPESLFFQEALRLSGRDAFGKRERLARLFRPAKPEGQPLIPTEAPETIDEELVGDMLRPGGNFSSRFPGYEFRPQQVQMLEAVAGAFNQGQHLLVEAGTGTGKSVGYLLPAAFWASQNGRRVVVSTNTINLQDQLLHKDIPELQQLLPFDLRATVLKGRRNYLCTRLFQELRHRGPNSAAEMALYARILVWLPGSQSGDVAEITQRSAPERLLWDRLNAENEGCTADKCAQEGCPLHIARRRAELAHILVVNHALLLADVASENRVLPEYVDLIADEAHHMEGAVTNALSFRADRRFLESLLDEIVKPRAGMVADVQRRAKDGLPAGYASAIDGRVNQLRIDGDRAVDGLGDFFDALERYLGQVTSGQSNYAEQIRITPAVRAQSAFDDLTIFWDNLYKQLRPVIEGLNHLAGDVADLSDHLEDAEDLWLTLTSLSRSLAETTTNIDALMAEPQEGMIYWVEQYRRRLSLHAAPLHIGPLVEKHIFHTKETVVMTSATLRTAGPGSRGEPSFAYLRDRLHADHADELAVGSPFDYERSTLLYLPTDIPEPNQPGYQRYVEQAIQDTALALDGRCLALFTSFKQLTTTADAIESPLNNAGISLLAQTQGASRQQLLAQFKAAGSRSVLLGARSFWEGIDVPGPALQAVFIVKFPFDVPSDPIFAARSETFDSPFFEYSIPETVLRFRQGFGRLIRRADDQGIVIVLDKRILSKRYGQAFLDALPPCTVLRQRIGRLGELTQRWINREES